MIPIEDIKKAVAGEVSIDDATLTQFSKDASLFEVRPEVVVAPRDVEDIKNLVKLVSLEKRQNPTLSLTARSAGTDMTGGPLSDSIVLDFLKYFNWLSAISDDGRISSAPGVFYRNFEKVTLKKDYFLPSYPASREICAIGGIVNNNSGGEQSLIYGKTQNYVEGMKVVLSDAKEYTIRKLNKSELDEKMKQTDFEGGIYRAVFGLLESNYQEVKEAKPKVSKNSVGYNVWDVWDREVGTFDLTKLFVGSQGTLGIMIEASLKLIKTKPYSGMAVVYLKDLHGLPGLINEVLKFGPSSLESFDDHTLKLSLKFLPGLAGLMGFKNLFSLLFSFLPDVFHVLKTGLPKLMLLIEFRDDDEAKLKDKLKNVGVLIESMNFEWRVARSKNDEKKYWTIRRESFNLLRHKVIGKQTAPYIDDIIVRPEYLPEFLPKLYEILDRYQLLYTIAGHVGDGNFHIIPLMDLRDPKEREKIRPSMEEVYDLVFQYHGSISAEHNDGLLRGPYIQKMFNEEIYKIFKDIKKIFDPQNIFNPHKKTDSSLDYTFSHIKNPGA
ncbi:MAG: FAD-binding oxidoreductase [bacterium]|nr:FAD-binding oxidoreductase [bacterium]